MWGRSLYKGGWKNLDNVGEEPILGEGGAKIMWMRSLY